MKIVKKIMSLTLMVTMFMLFIVPYVNAEDQTYSIILSNIDEREHTYYAYQIFTGTVDSQTSFCDLKWGNGINKDYRETILGDYGQKNIEGLSNLLCNDINANDFARYLCSNIGYLQNGCAICSLTKHFRKENKLAKQINEIAEYSWYKSG